MTYKKLLTEFVNYFQVKVEYEYGPNFIREKCDEIRKAIAEPTGPEGKYVNVLSDDDIYARMATTKAATGGGKNKRRSTHLPPKKKPSPKKRVPRSSPKRTASPKRRA